MNRIILKISLVYIAVLLTAVNVYSLNVESANFKNDEFNLNYTSSKKINYHKMIFKNPTRLVVDVLSVERCPLCRKGVLMLDSKLSTSKISLHTKNDTVYNKYKTPTLRIVFNFNNGSSVPNYKMEDKKGRLTITFNPKNLDHKKSKEGNVLERISFRKFKTYEMIVALLKTKPNYQVSKDKNVVYLTIKDALPTASSLEDQNLSSISADIEKIKPVKVSEHITKYAVYMKYADILKNSYSDKRHIYLIFNIPKQAGIAKKVYNSNVLSLESKTPKKSDNQHERKYTGKKISFNVRNADIQDIFRVFAQVSGLNFITSNDVKGTLTMKLQDVPWDQAFDLILQQKGLVSEKDGNIIRITTASKMQSEKMQELKAIEGKQELERAKNAVTKVIDLNYITPDYAMKMVNGLLYKKKSKSGFIVSDVKNNAVICHDTKDNIDKIQQIINTIDKRKKAVEIDARIVEISKTFERQLGIQWGGNYENYYPVASASHTFIGAGGTTAPANPFNPTLPQDNFIVNLPTTLSDAPVAGALSLAIGRSNYNLDLKLTAGEVEGYSKVLSSPRVITLDNEPAKIESGQDIPYQESAGASGATSVSFKSATLSLEVTPHITNNNQIILKIKVSKDSPDFAHAVNGEPPINTNTVDTAVVLSNGQTIVLGGLIQKTNLKSTSGVPVLMRVPLLGWLFKTKRIYNPESELFIFVTPKIVNENK